MWRRIFVCYLFSAFYFAAPAYAQILDEEPLNNAPQPVLPNTESNELSVDETEAMFNEMFQEHSEEDRNPEKSGTFENYVDDAAQAAQKAGVLSATTSASSVLEPLTGDMFIGVTKGSFKIFQNARGQTMCSFAVTLKSNLDRDLNAMGVRLVYPKRSFAFVFRKVAANGAQERYITTNGDICYDLTGVPDIEVNLCRIRRAMDNECAKRLKWSDDIEMPKE